MDNTNISEQLINALEDSNRRVSKHAAETIIDSGDDGLEVLASFLLGCSAAARENVCSAIRVTGQFRDRIVHIMTQELKNSDSSKRIHAALALGEINLRTGSKTEEQVEVLREALSGKDKDLRKDAAMLLSRLGESSTGGTNEKTIEVLLDALRDDDPGIRKEAAEALGNMKEASAVEMLIEMLEKDDEPLCKQAAASALGEIGEESAIGPLIEALYDEDLFIDSFMFTQASNHAAEALKIMGGAVVFPLMQVWPEATGGVEFFILDVLHDTYLKVPAKEIRKDKRAVEGLLKMLSSYDEESDIKKIKDILGHLNYRKAITKPLISDLDSDDPKTRQQAMQFLGALNELLDDKAISKALGRMYGDDDETVRFRALQHQGCQGTEESHAYLIAALKDQSAKIRAAAAKWMIHEYAREALRAALGDEDAEVRLQVALALGNLGDKEVLPIVLQAINDKRDDVRRSSILALREIGGEEAVKGLIEALHEESYFNKKLAIESLGSLGDVSAVEPLIEAMEEALDGGYDELQGLIAIALGDLGDKRALPVLERGLECFSGDGPDVDIEDAIERINQRGQ